jgi:hypothetical protein
MVAKGAKKPAAKKPAAKKAAAAPAKPAVAAVRIARELALTLLSSATLVVDTAAAISSKHSSKPYRLTERLIDASSTCW